jgi:predicted flap endonuclease-1-like 5' DNA nuclease
MTALSIETLLLMAAAYFLGAMCGCLVRRALYRPAHVQTARGRVDPLPQVVEGKAKRFAQRERAEEKAQASARAEEAAPGNLQRIRNVDGALEAELKKLGVDSYAQIAAWQRTDLNRVEQALGLPKGRINQENWIEQAQILAGGRETVYARRLARGETASAVPTPDEGEVRSPRAAASARAAVIIEPRPASGGAAGVVADVIAAGGGAAHSQSAAPAREISGAIATAAQPRIAAMTEQPASVLAAPAPAAQSTSAHSPAIPIRPTPPKAQDDLRRISGIDAAMEQRLVLLGITRYSQLALFSRADVERLEHELGTEGRIARENWVEQAQILSRGGDTAFAREYDRRAASGPSAPRPIKLADAIEERAARADEETRRAASVELGSLRSVRSEAYQNPEPGPQAAQRAAAQNKLLRTAAGDDLKRIRGIGVLIEKRLRALGVTSYEQIANWTARDIDRVSQTLEFKGRIERENWVEQARILAAGGATEFSRRVDRGEVDTGRART